MKRHFYHTARLFVILCAGWLAISCETAPTEVADYHPEPVLYAYLSNGEPTTRIYLERVAPIYGYYTPHGISGCDLKIVALTDPPDTFRFKQHPDAADSSFMYIPDGDTLIPQGHTRYRIELSTPEGEFVWGETTVPDRFSRITVGVQGFEDTTLTNPPAEIPYDSTTQTGLLLDTLNRTLNPLITNWDPVGASGGYVEQTICLQPADTNLIPLDPNWDPIKNPIDTTAINRSSTMFLRSDQTTLTGGWVRYRYQGMYQVQLQAVSSAYFDYLFTRMRTRQGTASAPQSNIHGGLGCFGGLTRFTYYIYIRKVQG